MSSKLSRRRVLAVAGTGLASLAGCVSSEPASTTRSPKRGSTTNATTGNGSYVPTDCSLPPTESVTTERDPPEAPSTAHSGNELTVTSDYDEPVSVVLTEHESGTTTFAHTYAAGHAFDVGDEMKDWLDYDVVLRAGCDVLWEVTVWSYEGYELLVTADGTVDVESSWVV